MKFSKIKTAQTIFRNRGFITKIPILFRMIKSIIRGGYPLGKSMKWVMFFSLIYIISPLDFIPDWIPFLGFFDDVWILSYILSKLTKEIDDFLIWEKQENSAKY